MNTGGVGRGYHQNHSRNDDSQFNLSWLCWACSAAVPVCVRTLENEVRVWFFDRDGSKINLTREDTEFFAKVCGSVPRNAAHATRAYPRSHSRRLENVQRYTPSRSDACQAATFPQPKLTPFL